MFLTFDKEQFKLSDYLSQHVTAPLVGVVARWSESKIIDQDTDVLVREMVASLELEPPRLLGAALGNDEGRGESRPVLTALPGFPEATVETSRKWVGIEVEGSIDLLRCWPDQNQSLEPIDHDRPAYDSPRSQDAAPSFEERLAAHEHLVRQEQWTIRSKTETGPRALYTFIDLTESEEIEVLEGTRNPRSQIESERRKIEPIVEAIATQTKDFLASELPPILAQAINSRRRKILARAAVRDNLTFPVAWRLAPPELADQQEATDADHTVRAETAEGEGSSELHLVHTPRLAPASFTDVQRVVRVWADGVERYPQAFGELEEDRLSDLLTVTLNACLPGANREVYTRGGKSDIYIRADVLAEGSGPAKIFICESKWWKGEAKADDGLTQLLGYLETKDTAAMLLFFVGLKDPEATRSKAAKKFAQRGDFLGRGESSVAGWPISSHRSNGSRADVCLAFVDLPPT